MVRSVIFKSAQFYVNFGFTFFQIQQNICPKENLLFLWNSRLLKWERGNKMHYADHQALKYEGQGGFATKHVVLLVNNCLLSVWCFTCSCRVRVLQFPPNSQKITPRCACVCTWCPVMDCISLLTPRARMIDSRSSTTLIVIKKLLKMDG